jgi:hypothetical protein
MTHEIRFYRASEKPYGAFSNLYRRPINFEDQTAFDENFRTFEAHYSTFARENWLVKCVQGLQPSIDDRSAPTRQILVSWLRLGNST